MRVVSWNLWWRFGDEWRERQVRIIEALQELRADIVGLQEVWAGRGTSHRSSRLHTTSRGGPPVARIRSS